MSNMYGFENLCSSNDLSHHGIKGQKWGIRRYQNFVNSKHYQVGND